jgi:hypothetical protein
MYSIRHSSLDVLDPVLPVPGALVSYLREADTVHVWHGRIHFRAAGSVMEVGR